MRNNLVLPCEEALHLNEFTLREQTMSKKQIGGPVVTVVIVVVVLLFLGFGYYYMNKDSMGKEGEARKLNAPGVLSKDYNPKLGPFPAGNGPGQPGPIVTPGGQVSGAGAPPPGAKVPGN